MREVRMAVQPLLQERKDLASIGRFVFIKPVHHLLRGVYIDSSRNPIAFVPHISVDLLTPAQARSHPGWGGRFFQAMYSPLIRESGWDLAKPETIAHLLNLIEEALPSLHSIQTFDDYFAYVSNLRMPWINTAYLEFLEMLIPAIKGELTAPLAILRRNEKMLAYVDRLSPDFYPALVAGDRVELARILHEWEAVSVKTYKIEKIWERTPFPLELQHS